MGETMMRTKQLRHQAVKQFLGCSVVLMMFTLSHNARAGLITPNPSFPDSKVIDEAGRLQVPWGWDPEEDSRSNPNLNNWAADLSIDRVKNGGEVRDNDQWEVHLSVRHKTDPHPELGENSGGDPAHFNFRFWGREYGLLRNEEITVRHGQSHSDRFRFRFDRSMWSPNTLIQLWGEHPTSVPEIDPAGMGSVAALVTGALGLLERRRVRVVPAS